MALTTVLLYGHLGRKYGQRWVFDIGSPAEAVRALRANCKGFEEAVIGYKPGYHVFVGKENIGKEDLIAPSGKEVIKIVPVVAGAGFGDFFKIIVGIALIYFTWGAAASLAPGATPTMAASLLGAGGSAFVSQLGVALVLSGVSSLLAPNPTEEKKNKPAHAFDGAQNTIAQGTPVPLGYGRMRVGSAVLSAGVYADQVVPVSTPVLPYVPGEAIEGPVMLTDPYYTSPGTGY